MLVRFRTKSPIAGRSITKTELRVGRALPGCRPEREKGRGGLDGMTEIALLMPDMAAALDQVIRYLRARVYRFPPRAIRAAG